MPGPVALWASDAGEIAVTKSGGGFDVLGQKVNTLGERYVLVMRAGLETRGQRLVAGLVLSAHGHPRKGGYKIIYHDGNRGNCALANLSWRCKGSPPVGALRERVCLGSNCGAKFMSEGPHNRLCAECAKRANASTSNIFEESESGELPDEMLAGGGTYK